MNVLCFFSHKWRWYRVSGGGFGGDGLGTCDSMVKRCARCGVRR